MQKEEKYGYIRIIIAMVIYGTIGIFVKYAGLPSGFIAFVRGIVGALFLILFGFVSKKRFRLKNVKKSLLILLISGAMIGVNWVLLFEAYNYTTVATATLCYYFAPIFIIVASPFTLKEKLSVKKIICVLVALAGMFFVSGVFDSTETGSDEIIGIILGLGAAFLYATIITLNKKIPNDISANDRTIVQLASAGSVMFVYSLFTCDYSTMKLETLSIVMLAIISIIHTGIAYVLYFGSVSKLKAQTAAMFSYIDPVVAIIVSAVILGEEMSLWSVFGAILILGSTFISEINFSKRKSS